MHIVRSLPYRGVSAQKGKVRSETPFPLVNRMTDACENITLPQTSFAGDNYTRSHLLRNLLQRSSFFAQSLQASAYNEQYILYLFTPWNGNQCISVRKEPQTCIL